LDAELNQVAPDFDPTFKPADAAATPFQEAEMKRLILLVLLALISFYVAWPAFTGYQIYQGLESNQPDVLASKIDFPAVRRSMRGPVIDQVYARIESVMKDLGPATRLLGDQIPKDNIEKIIDGALESVVSPAKTVEIYANGGSLNTAIKDAILNEINKMGGLMSVLKLNNLIKHSDGDGQNQGGGTITIGGFKIPKELGGFLKNKQVSDALGGLAGKFALDPEKLAGKLFPADEAEETTQQSSGKSKSAYGLGNVKSFRFVGPFAMQLGVTRSADATAPELTTEMTFKNYDWRITKLTPNLLDR
jgi:hypothetical protein